MKETSTSSAVDSLCQPFSIAGRKKGTADDRDLWPDMFRLIKQVQPTWVIGENVAHFTKMAFFARRLTWKAKITDCNHLLFQLAIGAPHKRDRLWLIAHAQSKRCDRRREDGHSEISKRQVCTDQQDHRQNIRGETAPDAQLCDFVDCDASDAAQGAIIGKKDQFYMTKTGMPRKVNAQGKDGSVGLARLVQLLPTLTSSEFKGSGRNRYLGSKHFRGAKTSEGLRTTSTT